jgi:hypothetical protein
VPEPQGESAQVKKSPLLQAQGIPLRLTVKSADNLPEKGAVMQSLIVVCFSDPAQGRQSEAAGQVVDELMRHPP